jgi:hypothetical protein
LSLQRFKHLNCQNRFSIGNYTAISWFITNIVGSVVFCLSKARHGA